MKSPVPIHGKSLLAVIKDENYNLRSDFLAEYYLEKITPRYAYWQAVCSDRWKYIRYPGLPGMDELYDLENDPGELENLYRSPEHQSKTRQMQSRLKQLLDDSEGVY